MFKFYLDGNLVSDPLNWADFTETIQRDDLIRGLLPKYEQKLNFNGGGYKYLFDTKHDNGFCNLVELRVDYKCGGAYETVLNGYIFLSDCKFNLNKCTVECSVQDNNFGARIYNNKSIELYLDSSLSKNLESITACVTKNTTFFRPSTGADIVGLRKVYPVWSVFKYLVDFISDGLIDFESDFLDHTQTQIGNRQRALAITTGAILRNLNNVSPKVSFDLMLKEVSKKYPLVFTIIQQASGRPLIKIENEDYFLGTSSGVQIQKIQDLRQSINNNYLYSEIGIGGDTAEYDATIHSVPDSIRMFFAEESYYFQTECNIDNKLDLVTSFICDSNIIEELVFTNTTNSAYNESVFFVECSYSSGVAGNLAIRTSLLTTSATPYYYNAGLTNAVISNNFNIYADLIQYINSNDIGFMATKTTQFNYPYHSLVNYTYNFAGYINALCSTTDLITYENDSVLPNHDTGNNYTANSRYTAPSNGHYYLKVNLKVNVLSGIPISFPTNPSGNPNIMIQFFLYIRKYSVANVLLDTKTIEVGPDQFYGYKVFNSFTNTFEMGGEHMFFLESGEYVETYFRWCSLPFKSYDSSGRYNGEATSARVSIIGDSDTYFKTLTTEGNGTLIAGNSLDYNVERLEFERPLSYSDYKILKADLSKSVVVNHDGLTNKTAWLRKTERNFTTGEMKWELISNINNSI